MINIIHILTKELYNGYHIHTKNIPNIIGLHHWTGVNTWIKSL
jgi:hypothetical protein